MVLARLPGSFVRPLSGLEKWLPVLKTGREMVSQLFSEGKEPPGSLRVFSSVTAVK